MRAVGAVRPEAMITAVIETPPAHRNTKNSTTDAVLKPCAMPYHGTKISAASGSSVNRMAVTQLTGACSSFTATWVQGRGGSLHRTVSLGGWQMAAVDRAV